MVEPGRGPQGGGGAGDRSGCTVLHGPVDEGDCSVEGSSHFGLASLRGWWARCKFLGRESGKLSEATIPACCRTARVRAPRCSVDRSRCRIRRAGRSFMIGVDMRAAWGFIGCG